MIFGVSIIRIIFALLFGYLIIRAGLAMLRGMAAPIPEPPPSGELRKVKINSVSYTHLTLPTNREV